MIKANNNDCTFIQINSRLDLNSQEMLVYKYLNDNFTKSLECLGTVYVLRSGKNLYPGLISRISQSSMEQRRETLM